MTTAVAGLYWRRSLLRGTQWRAVVLSTRDGRLRLRTPTEVVFDVPTRDVRADVTFWGVVKLTVDGTRYSLIGDRPSNSPPFHDDQLAELHAARAAGVHVPDVTSVDGERPIEQPRSSSDFITWWINVSSSGRPWRTVLPAVGVTMR